MELYFQQLQVWANNNDMVINFNKTKEIVMGPPSKTSHYHPFSSPQVTSDSQTQLNCWASTWTQIFRVSHTSRPSRPRQLKVSNSGVRMSPKTSWG